jgi:hypothetical protein
LPLYSADIAGGALKIYESRQIAALLLDHVSPAGWKQAIETDNILQKTSPGTAKRQASLIRARLQTLPKPLWQLVRDGNKRTATQAIFAGAVGHSRLLADFVAYDLADRLKTGQTQVSKAQWQAYVTKCRDRDPDMPTWSDSTVNKLGDSVFQILSELECLTAGGQVVEAPAEAAVMSALFDNGRHDAARILSVLLK